ncbi:hypothetical protein BCR44DRAFT_319773 [Catenaria anguillulae PL171]|uniref:Zn(2)-C6 fungal-type domain-containing protein n=1 Tax=Catenaria anguillulae PL171 TaxID=765915 RepID=A0A1Y2HPB8_9FUNG|nr:hypothetical protein BCR44DRAFT_319773 [Catenaria anguillulae PL171]
MLASTIPSSSAHSGMPTSAMPIGAAVGTSSSSSPSSFFQHNQHSQHSQQQQQQQQLSSSSSSGLAASSSFGGMNTNSGTHFGSSSSAASHYAGPSSSTSSNVHAHQYHNHMQQSQQQQSPYPYSSQQQQPTRYQQQHLHHVMDHQPYPSAGSAPSNGAAMSTYVQPMHQHQHQHHASGPPAPAPPAMPSTVVVLDSATRTPTSVVPAAALAPTSHVLVHEPPPPDVVAINLAPTKKVRITQACTNCRRRKVKCSGGFPCKHCSDFGHECMYATPAKRGPKSASRTSRSDSTSHDHQPHHPNQQGHHPASTSPMSPTFQPLSSIDATSPTSAAASIESDLLDIVANLTLVVNLDESGANSAGGVLSYGNSTGYHLLRGLPTNVNTEGVNLFTSILSPVRIHPIELNMHLHWFPPRSLALHLVNTYFATTHHWVPMLSKSRVVADVASVFASLSGTSAATQHHQQHVSSQPPTYEVLMQLYAVMALGALQVERKHFAWDPELPLSRILGTHAKRLLPKLFEAQTGRLEAVQSCTLLAILDNGQALGNTWLLDGCAARLAFAQGLHLDPRVVEQQREEGKLISPRIPSRVITWSIVVTLDRLSAAANGRPVMVHEDETAIDLSDVTASPESAAKYSNEQDLLLPQHSYWPHYARWAVVAGRVLRAVNSFRYRRSHLSRLLPELHATVSQLRTSIPAELAFDSAAFAHGVTPTTVALESVWLNIAITQVVVYLYRPLVTMIIAGVFAASSSSQSGLADATEDQDEFPRVRDLMEARDVMVHALQVNQSSTPSSSASSAAGHSNSSDAKIPPLYPQYLATLERAVENVVNMISTAAPWSHQFLTVSIHQLASILSAGRVVVAGGGSPQRMRDILVQVPRILARWVPHAPMAVHTFHIAVAQVHELDRLIHGPGTPPPTAEDLRLPLPMDRLNETFCANRVATQCARITELVYDKSQYAREMDALASRYLALGPIEPLSGVGSQQQLQQQQQQQQQLVSPNSSAASTPLHAPQRPSSAMSMGSAASSSGHQHHSPLLAQATMVGGVPSPTAAMHAQRPQAQPQHHVPTPPPPPPLSASGTAATPASSMSLPALDHIGEWALNALPEGFELQF